MNEQEDDLDPFLEDGITTEVVDGCLVISGVRRATVRLDGGEIETQDIGDLHVETVDDGRPKEYATTVVLSRRAQ